MTTGRWEDDTPTQRQLNYIDALIVERQVRPDLMRDSETRGEASWRIEQLQGQPFRETNKHTNPSGGE